MTIELLLAVARSFLFVLVAMLQPGESIAGLMARADAALYAAKAGGRNRVEAAPEPGPVSDTPAVRA